MTRLTCKKRTTDVLQALYAETQQRLIPEFEPLDVVRLTLKVMEGCHGQQNPHTRRSPVNGVAGRYAPFG